jgi:hypothetical protein
LFTPITTVTFEGVKLSDSLLPTSWGSTIWTVPGWVEVEEVVAVVVDEELVVSLLVDVPVEVLVVVVVLPVAVAVLELELVVEEAMV